jgi:GDP-L-fucose synthase
MNVLVTGGSGMVGQALKQLKPEWIYLSSKDVDLRNYTTTFNTITSYNPRVIIHLAANVGGLFKNLNHQSEMLYDNLAINMNVVKVCGLMNIRLIACLSTCIFPDTTSYPITEDKLHDGPPHGSNFGYAYAKRMMDVMCASFPRLNYTCIIPCNIYGPHDNFNIKHGHVIPGLIHKAYLAKEQDEPFQVFGTGKPLRQFIYSFDVAKIIIKIVSLTNSPKRIILAPSEEYNIHYIVKYIADAYQVEYTFDNDVQKDGQYKKTSSNQLLVSLLPDFKFTLLKDGLNQTMDWFDANYEVARK